MALVTAAPSRFTNSPGVSECLQGSTVTAHGMKGSEGPRGMVEQAHLCRMVATGSSLQGGHNASSNVCSGQKRPLWIHCYLLASCIYEECDSSSHGRGGSRSELSVVCQAWVGLSLHFSSGMK